LAQPNVQIWDLDAGRVRDIATVIVACGARPVHCRADAPPDPIDQDASAPLALVALGAGAPSETALEVIQRLGGASICVIAYGDAADQWPLGLRCRPLLAGACAVLDARAAGFSDELRGRLAHLLAGEAVRRREKAQLRAHLEQHGLVGESAAMLSIFRRAVRISALSDLHTLITGESGTGKQLLAEAIHRLDPKRRGGPFVALNCGAISAGVAESELFGHRRGAFTGADRDRQGLIRAAEGGVLFLDEIGELDFALQSKLLRVLQEGRVLSVGDDHERAVSIRVLAATNRDLEEMVRQWTFRADLFHRLNVLSIHVPPLRDRPDDIAVLVRHFLAKYRHLRADRVWAASEEFIAALAQDELPGNARQVENLVRRAIVHKDDDGPLGLADLPPDIWERAARQSVGTAPAHDVRIDAPSLLASHDWNLERALAACERSLLEAALRSSHGNQSETARRLGITPRSVYNKIRKHSLALCDT
jgi:transcriptional regulator with PAS, ATPase and Fis domain